MQHKFSSLSLNVVFPCREFLTSQFPELCESYIEIANERQFMDGQRFRVRTLAMCHVFIFGFTSHFPFVKLLVNPRAPAQHTPTSIITSAYECTCEFLKIGGDSGPCTENKSVLSCFQAASHFQGMLLLGSCLHYECFHVRHTHFEPRFKIGNFLLEKSVLSAYTKPLLLIV